MDVVGGGLIGGNTTAMCVHILKTQRITLRFFMGILINQNSAVSFQVADRVAIPAAPTRYSVLPCNSPGVKRQ